LRGVEVGYHQLDLIVGNEIILELKAVKNFEDAHYAQLRSYLRATGLHVGLLINFSTSVLAVRRVVF
jgi:GxxExxY protein